MRDILVQNIKVGDYEIEGILKLPGGNTNPTVGDVINLLLTFLVPLFLIILFFILIWGGIDYMFSQGNPEKVKAAHAKITTGIIGFILLLVSYLLVRLVSYIFGFSGGFI